MTKKQMLTDEEIIALQYKDGKDDHFVFARAIEQAILSKLNSAEPVAWRFVDDEDACISYQCADAIRQLGKEVK